jgi:hypothetical protein
MSYTLWGAVALAFVYMIGFSAPITPSAVVALSAWTVFVVVVVIIGRRHDRK